MAKAKSVGSRVTRRDVRPALTPEAEENQMIALATTLVKQRLVDGTASSQETTHYLKLAANKRKNELEMEILEKQKELVVAKTEQLQSQKRVEELYSEALSAMRSYSGQGE